MMNAPSSTFSHNKRTILQLIVGMVLMAIVLHFVDINELVSTFLNIRPSYTLLMIALIFADRVLMAYKWNPLLRALNIHTPLMRLVQLYIVSPVVGNFASGIGADLFRAYGVTSDRNELKSVFASMILERALGLLAMLLLMVVSLFVAPFLLADKMDVISRYVWIPVLGIVLLFWAGALFFRSNGSLMIFSSNALKFRVIKYLHQVVLTVRQYRHHSGTIVIVFVLTFLEQLVPVMMYYLFALSINLHISILELLAIVPVLVLITRLPISFDGIGVQEGAAVVLYSFVGVSPAEALLMSTIGRVVYLVAALPVCVHYFLTSRFRTTVDDLKNEANETVS